MGLLDALAGPDDSSTVDPNTGLAEAQRRQLMFNALGQTGALLWAAGEKQLPAQRAQYLAQIGNVPSNMQAQSDAMTQQGLQAQRTIAAKRQNQQQTELAAYVQTPEFQEQFKNLPPHIKALVVAQGKSGDIAGMVKSVHEATQADKWQAAPDGTLFKPATGDVFDPLRQTRYNINQTGAQGGGTGDVPGGGGAAGGDLTGEAFLQTLPTGYASYLRAMIQGRTPVPPQLANRPGGQKMLADLGRADENFEGTDYGARFATAKDFASGKAAVNATSLNTVIGHIGDLHDKAGKLQNIGDAWILTQPLNYIKNLHEGTAGKREVTDFYVARNAVADELARAFKGANLSDNEIRAWKESVSASMSPEQLQGAIETAVSLLNSRIGALQDQYKRGFGKEHKGLIEEKSRKVLERVQNNPLDRPADQRGQPQQGAPAGQPQAGPQQGGQPPAAYPNAVRAPDGRWVFEKNGQWFDTGLR